MHSFIKFQPLLFESPKTLVIAREMGCCVYTTIGYLMKAWTFADTFADAENRVYGLTEVELDKALGIPNLSRAMEIAGWLEVGNGWIEFPNYRDDNGTTARSREDKIKQKRDYERQRKAEYRARKKAESKPEQDPENYQNSMNLSHGTNVGQGRDIDGTKQGQAIYHIKTFKEKNHRDSRDRDNQDEINFNLTDEGLAQEWCFTSTRKKNRRPADDPIDLTPSFRNLTTNLKVDRQFLWEQIKAREDTDEYFWKFKNRVLELWEPHRKRQEEREREQQIDEATRKHREYLASPEHHAEAMKALEEAKRRIGLVSDS